MPKSSSDTSDSYEDEDSDNTAAKTDADIIKAIFDSYLATRITEKERGWTDFTLGGKTLPSSVAVADKLRSTIKLVEILPKIDANTGNDARGWFDFLIACKRLELVQHQAKEETRHSYAGLGKYFVGEESRFEQMLCAVRSYIATEMNSQSKSKLFFAIEREKLAAEKTTREQEYNSAKTTAHANPKMVEDKRKAFDECTLKFNALAEANVSDYHETFFTNFMCRDKRIDNAGGALEEKEFTDFNNNVADNARKLDYLDKLMGMKTVLFNPKAVANKTALSSITGWFASKPEPVKPKPEQKANTPKH